MVNTTPLGTISVSLFSIPLTLSPLPFPLVHLIAGKLLFHLQTRLRSSLRNVPGQGGRWPRKLRGTGERRPFQETFHARLPRHWRPFLVADGSPGPGVL